MDDLLSGFRAAAPAGLGPFPEAEVGRALADLVARGRVAWPDVEVGAAAVVAKAARSLPETTRGPDVPAALDALHAHDLHLAAGCALGLPTALAAFERVFLGAAGLRAPLLRIDPSASFADEVRQAVREKLFVGKAGAPGRIAHYSGRWPLLGWLRTIAVRTAIDLRRAGGSAPAPDEAADAQLAAVATPELRYLKDRYGGAFKEAIGAAFDTLDDEQCNLLRLQVLDGLRTAQIAALFQVDRSTIKRRLAGCREQVLLETRRRLRETLKLSAVEFESLAGLLQSELHVSLARLLQRP